MGHTLTTVTAFMGTAARIDNDYPRSSKGTVLECVVCHYLMSLCRLVVVVVVVEEKEFYFKATY
jgi:hypothetical protein